MRDALLSLGPELNDLLGVCASRVHALPPASDLSASDQSTSDRSAAWATADAAVEPSEESGYVGDVVCATAPEELAMAAREDALRIVIRATASPKCERCWRYVPAEAARGVEGVRLGDDGWLYRGCACGS